MCLIVRAQCVCVAWSVGTRHGNLYSTSLHRATNTYRTRNARRAPESCDLCHAAVTGPLGAILSVQELPLTWTGDGGGGDGGGGDGGGGGYTPHRTGAGGRIAPQRVSRVVFRFIWHRKCVYCSFFIKNRVLKN